MNPTFILVITTTLLIPSTFWAAHSTVSTTEASSGNESNFSTRHIDVGVSRSLLSIAETDLKNGLIEAAIIKYKEVVQKGSAKQAGEAAYKLSRINKVPIHEKIEALESVVYRGEAQWAYTAASTLALLDSHKGIGAFQAVANMGTPKFAVIAGKALLEMKPDKTNLPAVVTLKSVIHMREAFFAWEAAMLLSEISELKTEEILVLKEIVSSLDEVLKADPVDFGCKSNKRLIERLLAQYSTK